ncbi:hypothetical protein [Halomonas sp. DWK9]|uniref:hypothetical protein n=1 Tax=Halomonas sp. DWK9 TaxID=3060155 RepID=UPI00287F7FB6|nr:hypothetical protein [Halomonas sp. DWK9]
MQLDDFVAETLIQIVNGVKKARQATGIQGIGAQPSKAPSANSSNPDIIITAHGASAQSVRFDVALTVSEDTGTSAKIGVVSGILNGGGTMEDKSQNTSVSRVQFAIPVILPTPRKSSEAK